MSASPSAERCRISRLEEAARRHRQEAAMLQQEKQVLAQCLQQVMVHVNSVIDMFCTMYEAQVKHQGLTIASSSPLASTGSRGRYDDEMSDLLQQQQQDAISVSVKTTSLAFVFLETICDLPRIPVDFLRSSTKQHRRSHSKDSADGGGSNRGSSMADEDDDGGDDVIGGSVDDLEKAVSSAQMTTAVLTSLATAAHMNMNVFSAGDAQGEPASESFVVTTSSPVPLPRSEQAQQPSEVPAAPAWRSPPPIAPQSSRPDNVPRGDLEERPPQLTMSDIAKAVEEVEVGKRAAVVYKCAMELLRAAFWRTAPQTVTTASTLIRNSKQRQHQPVEDNGYVEHPSYSIPPPFTAVRGDSDNRQEEVISNKFCRTDDSVRDYSGVSFDVDDGEAADRLAHRENDDDDGSGSGSGSGGGVGDSDQFEMYRVRQELLAVQKQYTSGTIGGVGGAIDRTLPPLVPAQQRPATPADPAVPLLATFGADVGTLNVSNISAADVADTISLSAPSSSPVVLDNGRLPRSSLAISTSAKHCLLKPQLRRLSMGLDIAEDDELVEHYSSPTQGKNQAVHRSILRIVGVRDGSPAAMCGVLAGDVLHSINETRVRNHHDLHFTLSLAQREPLGTPIIVTLMSDRGGHISRRIVQFVPQDEPFEGLSQQNISGSSTQPPTPHPQRPAPTSRSPSPPRPSSIILQHQQENSYASGTSLIGSSAVTSSSSHMTSRRGELNEWRYSHLSPIRSAGRTASGGGAPPPRRDLPLSSMSSNDRSNPEMVARLQSTLQSIRKVQLQREHILALKEQRGSGVSLLHSHNHQQQQLLGDDSRHSWPAGSSELLPRRSSPSPIIASHTSTSRQRTSPFRGSNTSDGPVSRRTSPMPTAGRNSPKPWL